jgi:glycosyltransferase involved in cell wall biosynthesis
MFVLNDCRTDARVLREAATLVEAGHQVTIMARPTDLNDQRPERELRNGFEIIRIPVPLRWRRRARLLAAPWQGWRLAGWWAQDQLRAGPAGWVRLAAAAIISLVAIPLVVVGALLIALIRVAPGTARFRSGVDWLVRWRTSTEEWDRAAAAAAPSADIFHAHDLNALHAGVLARARAGGALVYDSHEIFLESGSHAVRPAWARRIFRRREAAWAGQADALVTVNDALARELGARYAPHRVVVVHNCLPRPGPAADGPRPLRAALDIGGDTPVALYHGVFSKHRGLEELVAAAALPDLDGAHVVFLGYGSLTAELRALVASSPAAGRLHVLAAVAPDALIDWVRDADVAVMPIQDSTLNHRLSTPNKLFEALAAGVPIVASDLPEMRRIVMDDPAGPLGLLCDPTDPASIAAAVAALLGRPPAEAAALRERCLTAARDRWNWETESARLVALYADLAAAPAG